MFDKIMNHPELLRCVTVISNAYVQIPVGQNIKTFTATLQSVLHLNCSWRLENNETSNKAVSLPLYLCRTWCQDINLHLYYFLCFVYSPNSVQQLGPDILALEVQPYSLPLSDGEMGEYLSTVTKLTIYIGPVIGVTQALLAYFLFPYVFYNVTRNILKVALYKYDSTLLSLKLN